MKSYIVEDAQVVLPDRIETGKAVVVKDGIIAAVTGDPAERARYESFPIIEGDGCYLSPGFVELHIHGCGDASVDAAVEDETVLRRMREILAGYGVNTFVPTMMCNPPLITALAGQIEADSLLKNSIPGLYVEGPFVNLKKRGGILPEFVHKSDLSYLGEILDRGRGCISLMTLAPELEGISDIATELDSQGVLPCFGHSLCTCTQAQNLVVDSSKRNVTHLFNAMSGISHKEAGLAMLPFLDDRVFAELNGDGIHLNNETIRLCGAHLNREKLILISDAVVTAGLPHGKSVYYGREVASDTRGVRYTENGILIGSNMLIPQVLKRFIDITGTSLPDAVLMATGNPCRLLGIEDRRGSIEIGKEADLILLEDDLTVRKNLAIPA